jgi:hypothetical protein
MSDYLTRLGEHALGIGNFVEPAIAPLFAPISVAMLPIFGDEETGRSTLSTTDEFAGVTTSAAISPINARTVMVPLPVKVDKETFLEDVHSPTQPSLERDASNRAVQPRLSLPTENFHAAQPILATAVAAEQGDHPKQQIPQKNRVAPQLPGMVPHSSSADLEDPSLADSHLSMNERVKSLTDNVEAGAARRTPAKLSVHSLTAEPRHPELTTDDARNVDARTVTAYVSNLNAGKREILGATPAARVATSAQNTSAPIVRVNIGRIEVRAIQPAIVPPPVPRREPVLPSVTLSDYLMKKRGAAT